MAGSVGITAAIQLDVSPIVATLTLNGPVIQNTGATTLTVTEDFTWNGGNLNGEGTLTVQGETTLAGGSMELRGFTLVPNGGARWSGGNVELHPSTTTAGAFGSVEIPAGTTFEVAADAPAFLGRCPTCVVLNEGTIRKTSPGRSEISAQLEDFGTIEVQAGTLSRQLTGFHQGSAISVASGATFEFGFGTREVMDTQFFGGGTVSHVSAVTTFDPETTLTTDLVVESGQLTVDGTLVPRSYEHLGGTLDGMGDLSVEGTLLWTDGSLGTFGTVSVGGMATLEGTSTLRLRPNATLDLDGGADWRSGTLNIGNALLTNGETSLFRILTPGAERIVLTNGTFLNFGVVEKTAASPGLTVIEAEFINSGTVRLLDGTVEFLDFTNEADGTVEGVARMRESSPTSLPFFNLGTFAPGWPSTFPVGVLDYEGDFEMSGPSAVLDIEIGDASAGAGNDAMDVLGAATLAGTLRVRFLDGAVPRPGDRFAVVIATSIGATFDALDLPPGVTATVEISDFVAELVIGTVTADEDDATPSTTALRAPSPNPARGTATVRYNLAAPSAVRLDVFDLLGRHVATLTDRPVDAGRHTVRWDTRGLPAGAYVVRLHAGGALLTQRVTLVR